MISDVGEEPDGVREVRDATGFVVGSPEWLAAQRRIERDASPGLQREGMWYVALGGIIIAISLFTTLSIITSDDSMGLKPSPAGYVVIGVAPLLLGLASIRKGLRQRGGPREVLTSLPPSVTGPVGPSDPPSAAGPPEQP